MKKRKEFPHWTLSEKLLVIAAWVTAIFLLVAVIIKIRVLFEK
jgi:hypothetical protein